jgi:hypothetical protein
MEKRGRGRPRRLHPTMQIGCRIEVDLYVELKRRFPDINLTKYINSLIRKDLQL